MMPRTYNEALIGCPFYQSMTKKSILCEGITDDCTIKLLFTSSEKHHQHRNIFCNNKYENCEIYAILEKKYEE